MFNKPVECNSKNIMEKEEISIENSKPNTYKRRHKKKNYKRRTIYNSIPHKKKTGSGGSRYSLLRNTWK